MAANVSPCQVNSATSIADPGIDTNAFGVRIKRNIYIVVATANFTANGVACIPGNVSFGNNPFLVTGAVSSAQVGTIWYYVE